MTLLKGVPYNYYNKLQFTFLFAWLRVCKTKCYMLLLYNKTKIKQKRKTTQRVSLDTFWIGLEHATISVLDV